MSTKLGWFAVTGRPCDDVAAALERIARDMTREESPENGFRVETTAGNTSVMLYGWEYPHVHRWAARVSDDLRAPTLAFHLFDGHWNYSVHAKGQELAEMTAYDGEVSTSGDPNAAGEALAIDPGILQRYIDATVSYFALGEQARKRRAKQRVFPDDEFPIADEWVHCDLARRVGVRYPADRGTIVRPDRPPPMETPAPRSVVVDLPARVVFRGS